SSNRFITLDCLAPQIAACADGDSTLPRRLPGLDMHNLTKLVAQWPTLEELECRYLHLVLNHTGGNRRRAASLLGIDRRTIQRLIARYQLAASPDPENDVEYEETGTKSPDDE